MSPRSHEKRFFPTVPRRPYSDMSRIEVQKAIDIFHETSEDITELGQIDGISIIEDGLALPDDMSCFEFIFGDNTQHNLERLILEGTLCWHEPGAVAYYFNRGHRKLKLRHVGLVLPTGDVLSKWGVGGPVIKHHPDFVLSPYGRIRGYYKDPSNQVIERVRKVVPDLEDLKELV